MLPMQPMLPALPGFSKRTITHLWRFSHLSVQEMRRDRFLNAKLPGLHYNEPSICVGYLPRSCVSARRAPRWLAGLGSGWLRRLAWLAGFGLACGWFGWFGWFGWLWLALAGSGWLRFGWLGPFLFRFFSLPCRNAASGQIAGVLRGR